MNRYPGTFAAGLVFIAIGIVYVLEALGAWTVDATRLWPVVLIAIGVTVLFSGGRRDPGSEIIEPPTDDES